MESRAQGDIKIAVEKIGHRLAVIALYVKGQHRRKIVYGRLFRIEEDAGRILNLSYKRRTSSISCRAIFSCFTFVTKEIPAFSPAIPGRFGVPLSNLSGISDGCSNDIELLPVPPCVRVESLSAQAVMRMPVPIGP